MKKIAIAVLLGLVIIATTTTSTSPKDIIPIKSKSTKVGKVGKLKIAKKALTKEGIDKILASRKLDSNVNYNPYNLREVSNASYSKIWNMLDGTSFQSEDVVDFIYEQENGDNPVNAVFLIALCRNESGHGYSSLAQSHNNLGGVKSRDGRWAYYNTKLDSIKSIYNLISNEYLNPNGSYYNGTSIWNVREKYCQDNSQWEEVINSIANKIKE